MAQLCSIRLKQDDVDIIQLEPKVDLVKRTGQSPDEADAVVMAWSKGAKQDNFRGGWENAPNPRSRQRAVKRQPRSAGRFDSKRYNR